MAPVLGLLNLVDLVGPVSTVLGPARLYRPFLVYFSKGLLDGSARFPPIVSRCQEFIVSRLPVSPVPDDGQTDGLSIKCLGRGRPSNASTIFKAGVLRYLCFPSSRTCREKHSYPCSELIHIPAVQFLSASGLSLSSQLPDILVGKTLFLRLLQSLRFDEQSLAFISFPSTAPLQYNRRKSGVLAGASGQGRIPGREEKKMVQIGDR